MSRDSTGFDDTGSHWDTRSIKHSCSRATVRWVAQACFQRRMEVAPPGPSLGTPADDSGDDSDEFSPLPHLRRQLRESRTALSRAEARLHRAEARFCRAEARQSRAGPAECA